MTHHLNIVSLYLHIHYNTVFKSVNIVASILINSLAVVWGNRKKTCKKYHPEKDSRSVYKSALILFLIMFALDARFLYLVTCYSTEAYGFKFSIRSLLFLGLVQSFCLLLGKYVNGDYRLILWSAGLWEEPSKSSCSKRQVAATASFHFFYCLVSPNMCAAPKYPSLIWRSFVISCLWFSWKKKSGKPKWSWKDKDGHTSVFAFCLST